MNSQIFCGTDLSRMKFDLNFTETINRSMQVPNKLKILEEPASVTDGTPVDDQPPYYQMHLPERLSLAEMMEASLMPFHWEQVKRNGRKLKPSITPASQGYSAHASPAKEIPLFEAQSGSSTQGSLRRVQENICSEETSSGTRDPAHRLVGQEMCSSQGLPLPFPSRVEDGRIYSLSNVCRTICCLGSLLFSRLRKSSCFPARPSSQDTDPNRTRPIEDLGLLEIVAMRNQLIKISKRLQNLEEERAGGYQKELLIYSALLTAWLINTLLWLRK